MDNIESKGKSVDEAIFNGLSEMGLGLDEVEIEILHEGSKGLFGIGKNAVVRLTKRGDEDLERIARQKEKEEAEYIAQSERRDNAERPRGGQRRERERKPDRQREKREYPNEEELQPPVDTLTYADGSASEFLNGLFKLMKIDASSRQADAEENILKVEIKGKDTAVLIGRRGDTLDALQYLTGLVINKSKSDYKKVMLDAENYRFKREQTLMKLARRLASNVLKSGKPVTLEPMNPYERRILHATLQSNPRVETHSEGEDPYRRVVIKRKR